MRYPPKPRPGDRVAVLSPASGLPQLFPEVFELGLRRLTETFGLQPVEYPTTRVLGASGAARAADLHAAFADPQITAILASIGGEDQITVIPHLDRELIAANPKPFFGYSDNTNLLHFLYGLGTVGFHGGSVMVHLGRSGSLHPAHAASLRAALFVDGWFEFVEPADWGDETYDWRDTSQLVLEPPMWTHEPWIWPDTGRVVEGESWGGNIEVLSWILQAGRVATVGATVLFLETSEDMPSATEVYWTLRSMGERGLLQQFEAVLWARPKACEHDRPNPPDVKRAFIDDQYAAVRRALSEYNPEAVLVLGVDFGHTDPQLIVPYGGTVRVDASARRISVRY
jgi:muramoyltetrapeptide carboxypeptidase LdcA involved in peptidoglycan recycling